MNAALKAANDTLAALPCLASAEYERPMDSPAPEPLATGSGLAGLLTEMRPTIERFMQARGCDRSEAEDLVQDLFLKVGELRTGPIANPRAYLFRMAANLVLDARRGRRRQQSREDSWVRARYGFELDRAAEPSPEASAISHDLLARVQAAIGAMPARTAEVLRLYRLEGLPQKEIAQQLGLSLSAIEKHLQRAYRALADIRQTLDGGPERENADG
ncbi:MAG: RNA polymerase sigma factor [Tsuneonella sp.]